MNSMQLMEIALLAGLSVAGYAVLKKQVGGGGQGGRYSGPLNTNFQANVDADPALPTLMWQWQVSRVRQGQNPYDWAAFRSYVVTGGRQDPGQYPPRNFTDVNFDWVQ